ncbi:ribosomal protein S18 acetylase RimI-like enzyme [Bacillus sp. SORGH_AS 510]|uniref:GNAT family N-acetyltransferase n=1 Tax=Bacillus sp. SORGH_AS_0510 TaxID=3041771 RepID=UPI0027898F79|nr:GNAT family N-acetyltransferase [Bacillus sp. SORGH_AS_0510]MDQ1143849.1 ribosomal protein S18 acetylase RimI-like enzyme [Bacillus sp. SORGH_AS_0510]
MECFFVDVLWVDESLRGQGKGQELIQIAETFAREKGCTLMRLETFSFQAPEFYKKLGFKEIGKLDNFPKGFTH